MTATLNYTDKLYASSNVITAFVVLQSVGFVTFVVDAGNTSLFYNRYMQIVCVASHQLVLLLHSYATAVLRLRRAGC